MKRKYTVPIFLFVFAFWLWSVIIEPYCLLNEKHIDATVKNFPKGFENLKIAVVSDIHVGRGYFDKIRFNRIVNAVNANNPDIILFLGDYSNGYFYQTSLNDEILTQYMSKFKAKIAKVGILGNHDNSYGKKRIISILKNSGITVLDNSNTKISTPHGDFYVAGIADSLTDIYLCKKAVKDIPKGAPIIFLTHNPSVLPEIPDCVGLVLAGHTHGGQIRIPFIGNVFPIKYTPRKFVAGFNELENFSIYTSMGLGTSRFPIRFYCTPEFTILKIIPKQ